MKVKKFKSFRFKMVMYMFLSVLATFLTEGMIFAGIYFYETEILAGEYRKVWGASGQGRLALGMFTASESVSLDILVILIFTMLLLVMYFILISHNFVTYVREIISGVYASDFGLWNTNVGQTVRHQMADRKSVV